MDGEIDFDPLSAEGRMNINDIIEEEHIILLPQKGESDGAWYNRFYRRFGKGTLYAMDRLKYLFKVKNYNNPLAVVPEPLEFYTRQRTEPSPDDVAIPSNLWVNEVMMESNLAGLERVKDILPRFDENKAVFNWGIDQFGRDTASWVKKGG